MSHKRILIVDDEEHIREIASMSLELAGGWKVTTAACGSDAVLKAVDSRPDAILLDVMMPEMDGPMTFRILRSRPETASIPVIFLTAKVQAADKRLLAELGVDAVMAKPFDPLSLAANIAAALGWESPVGNDP